MASTRSSLVQTAQANIKRQLLEGDMAQFFRGMGDRIIAADPGELLTSLAETLASLSLGIVIEVTAGEAPHWDRVDWDAELTIFENPVLNRPGDGKTADMVLDAVFRCFVDGGAFYPTRFAMLPGDERVGWVVTGTTPVAMLETPNPGGNC